MAAITPSSRGFGLGHVIIRQGTSQQNTGQTDWIWVPRKANFAVVTFALTASGGTTPVTNITLLGADPIVKDDTYSYHLGGVTVTAQNTTGSSGILQVVNIGPGITQAADDVALGATGVNHAAINTILPALMGFGLVLDRTSANENYTYTFGATFR